MFSDAFNDNNIAYSDHSKIIQIFNLNTKTCIKKIISDHTYLISDLTALNNGNLVSVSNNNSSIKIWNIEKNLCVETLDSYEFFGRFLITLTNNKIAICYYSKIVIWDLQNKKVITTINTEDYGCSYINGLAKLSTGELISTTFPGTIHMFANPTYYKIDNSQYDDEVFYV